MTISYVSDENDKKVLEEIQTRFTVKIAEYPTGTVIDSTLYMENK